MSSAKALREARRRKILDRGQDRLAYITGQAKELPPTQPSSVVSPPGEAGLRRLSNPGELPISSEGPAPTSSRLFDVSDISRTLASLNALLQSGDSPQAETAQLPPPSSTGAPALHFSTSRRQEANSTTAKRNTASTLDIRPKFTYGALVKSIEQSVFIRAILAFFLAALLVTQWTYARCQHPWGLGSSNYILSWPIFLVIITDITVVLSGLFLGLIKMPPAPEKEKAVDRGGLAVFLDSRIDQMLAYASQLEVALDFGLLVTKASRGLSADIGLYLVTVVCAVSVAQHFQPGLCVYIIR